MKSILLASAVLLSGTALAQVLLPEGSQPSEAATVQGRIDRFLLSSNGELDGFLLDDGTEVHLAPYLGERLSAIVRPGAPVLVRGYRATGLAFVNASSVTSTLNNKQVVDDGVPVGAAAPSSPAGSATTVEGTVKQPLHGANGAVNGALLANGVEIRMPEGIVADWPSSLRAGQKIAVGGRDLQTEYGRVIRITSFGPTASQLSPVTPGYQSPPQPRDHQ